MDWMCLGPNDLDYLEYPHIVPFVRGKADWYLNELEHGRKKVLPILQGYYNTYKKGN